MRFGKGSRIRSTSQVNAAAAKTMPNFAMQASFRVLWLMGRRRDLQRQRRERTIADRPVAVRSAGVNETASSSEIPSPRSSAVPTTRLSSGCNRVSD